MNKKVRPIVAILCGILVFYMLYMAGGNTETVNTYSESQLLSAISDGKVEEIFINQNKEVPTGEVIVKIDNQNDLERFYVSDVSVIEDIARENEIKFNVKNISQESFFMKYGITLISIVLVLFFINILLKSQRGVGGSNAKMMNFGKSRAKLSTEDNKVRLTSVAGLEEEKEDLEEIVDFLKNPGKYTKIGARIPKGILLEGRPGTGKTLLAKALAGEAGVPFFSISGSDFVEMFVGVGASRVRDLFEEAKKSSPSVVFIDEIDAVARRRGTGMGGGHDEREQTLNQLLVEMDGFGENQGIIVLAATNRVDILDPAILRPGRFDRKISIASPDVRGREAILRVHAKNKSLAEDIDFKKVAQTTAGFTGADLENLLNEAAIGAAKKESTYIMQADIEQAFIKVGIGSERKSRVISDEEKKVTAYHEAGHGILFHLLEGVGPVHTISIIPTGNGAAGYTMPLPERDDMFRTKNRMLNDIKVLLGGRIAEEIIFGDITTGASNDIKRATATARKMITKYGMSLELGTIDYDSDGGEVFIGRDLAQQRPYSEETANKIDKEVKEIIDMCYKEAKDIIVEQKEVLEKCAKLLLEKEKIGREEFEALF